MTQQARDRDDWSGLPARPLSPAEFCGYVDRQGKEFKRQPRWGAWTLDKNRLVLTNTECSYYEIDVETCRSPEEVLDWLAHVAGRYSPQELGHLVVALDDLLGFRDSLLASRQWAIDVSDVRQHLKQRGWLVRPRTKKTR